MIDKGQWREFGPLLVTSAMGFFNDHRESEPWFNVSSERQYQRKVQLQGIFIKYINM